MQSCILIFLIYAGSILVQMCLQLIRISHIFNTFPGRKPLQPPGPMQAAAAAAAARQPPAKLLPRLPTENSKASQGLNVLQIEHILLLRIHPRVKSKLSVCSWSLKVDMLYLYCFHLERQECSRLGDPCPLSSLEKRPHIASAKPP